MFDVPYCCAFYGHSHAARLFTAYDALVTENGEENIKPIFKFGLLRGLEKMLDDDDDSPDLHTEVRSLIENMNSEPEPEVIVTILKGSATNVFSQPRHPRPFDFILPDMADAGIMAGAEVIPYTLLKRRLAHEMQKGSEEFRHLLTSLAPGKPVYFVPPPPPVSSEEFLCRQTGRLPRQLNAVGVNPRIFRRKFWLAGLDLLRDVAATHGAEVIDLPPEVFDEEGLLAERFWEDASHGNQDYSLLLLKTIDCFIRSKLAR